MDGGKVVAPQLQNSGKVCLVCRSISKRGDAVDFDGYHIFVLNLSELFVDVDDGSKSKGYGDGDLQLQPTILLDFDSYDFDCSCMAVYGLDSKLYFFENTRSPKNLEVYYLDISQHQKDTKKDEIQHLSTADFLTLPRMSGYKSRAMITSIPGTKKILVFSSLFDVYTFDPDWAAHGGEDADVVVDDDDDYVDFEIYDWLTNSWEVLPLIIIRADFKYSHSKPRYFLHESGSDKRGREIPRDAFASRQIFHEFLILKYTFVHTDTSSSSSLLVELSCGLMIILDLSSPSKGWKLVYNEAAGSGRVTLKPPQTQTQTQSNFFIVADQYHDMWCLSDIGQENKLASAERFPLSSVFPLSSFGKDDPVKLIIGSSLTPLPLEDDDDKQQQQQHQYFCIVQGALSKKSKLPQVIMDVVDVQAAPPQPVASCRFGVPTHKCKRFVPFCIFPYHPYP